MTASFRSVIRYAPIAAALVLAPIALCPGQTLPRAGTFFAEPGTTYAKQDEPYPVGEQDSVVVPASWDSSSWLLERSEPSSPAQSRPGFMGRLADLARGRVMIEGGYSFLTDSAAGTTITEHVMPDLLLRVGVTERIEVRIGWPGVSVVDQNGVADGSDTTTLDPNVGFMLDLWPQSGWLPQTAILGAVPVTLGGNRFAMDSLQPTSAVLYQWRLTDRLSFGGDSGLAFFRDDGDHYLQWQQSVDVDYLLTDRVGLFSQWQMLADDGSADDTTRHMLSAGVSWLCTDRLQITWETGLGLNDSAPDLLTSVRFGVLF